MIKKKKLRKAALFLFLCLLMIPFAVTVNASEINTVEMWVVIHADGSATIKEAWDISIDGSANTEWYVTRHNLDNMQISNLVVEEVTDDEVITFETLDRWDVHASRDEKAQRCGLLETDGGYDVCWGFGETGHHKYNVSYNITDIVKGYKGGDAMGFVFLDNTAGGVNTLNIYLQADDFDFIYPNTRVWVMGYKAQSTYTDGGISVLSDGRLSKNNYAAVMIAFDPHQLNPADQRGDSIDEFIDIGLKGSIWEDDNTDKISEPINVKSKMLKQSGKIILLIIIMYIFTIYLHRKSVSKSTVEYNEEKRLYKKVDHCRELPFGGDIIAAYTRLNSLEKVPEGRLIGCYLLKWMRTGQVSIITEKVGFIVKRDQEAIQLNQTHTVMSDLERELYNMVCTAAGSDGILQEKEFEKWSRKKYDVISKWFSRYKSTGDSNLENMGVYERVPVKRLFGLIQSTKRSVSDKGKKLTENMLGFKRYLDEFTIINEREAHEVELWEEYLIFAQLFGIADRVMAQFQQLYPDYFARPEVKGGYYNAHSIVTVMAVSDSFSSAMSKGYQSGRSSSGSSASGGGGRSSSSGGGSSFSGRGGGGAGAR